MKQKISWHHWLLLMFKEFVEESKQKSGVQIVDINECPKTGSKKAILKLSERHITEKNISDIIVDDALIENFDSKTVRALTYMATIERLGPDYSIVVQKMSQEVDEYILELKSKRDGTTLEKTSSEISKDKELLSKLNPVEAHRVGYMTGVRETTKEYQLLSK